MDGAAPRRTAENRERKPGGELNDIGSAAEMMRMGAEVLEQVEQSKTVWGGALTEQN